MRPDAPRHLDALRHGFYRNDHRGAAKLGAGVHAEADRPLSNNRHGYAHGLMPDGEALGYGILAPEDEDVGSTDGGGCESNQRIVGSDIGYRLVIQDNSSRLDEHGGSHHLGHNRGSLLCNDAWSNQSIMPESRSEALI
jgi:hypothetical protein